MIESSAAGPMRAVHDPHRRGILIPSGALSGTTFQPGDRFSVRKGRQEFFTLSIVRDPGGPILFDRRGILIERTRRVDILLGGIFDAFDVDLSGEEQGRITLRPVEEDLPKLGGGA